MNYDRETLRRIYRRMTTIRLFEEKVGELFLGGEIPGFVHLYVGEEAIAVGVCENLTDKDYITSTHRGHGHCIARGAQPQARMADLVGKKTGSRKGTGGSMHIPDFSLGMLGANGVVGGGYNLAVGAGLAAQMRKSGQVAVCFFGDGASNRGTFHEGMNMASAWKLPVIFVNENNQWASTTPYRTTNNIEDIADRAKGYGIPGVVCDGNDIFAVLETAKAAVERARSGGGPTLIEAKTYRIKGHFVGDPEMYRTREEVQKHFIENDPIKNFTKKVIAAKLLKQADLDAIRDEVAREIEQAVADARQAPYPAESELFEDLYVEGVN